MTSEVFLINLISELPSLLPLLFVGLFLVRIFLPVAGFLSSLLDERDGDPSSLLDNFFFPIELSERSPGLSSLLFLSYFF